MNICLMFNDIISKHIEDFDFINDNDLINCLLIMFDIQFKMIRTFIEVHPEFE